MTTSKRRSTTNRLLPRGVGDESYRKANRERQAKLRAGRKAEAQAAAAEAERHRSVDALILSALFSRPDEDFRKRFEAAFPGVMRQVYRDVADAGFDPAVELTAAVKRHKKVRTRNADGNAPPTPADTPVTRTSHNPCPQNGIADWTKEEIEFFATDFDHCTYEDPRTGEIRHVSDRDADDRNDDPDPDDVGAYDDVEDDLPEGHG